MLSRIDTSSIDVGSSARTSEGRAASAGELVRVTPQEVGWWYEAYLGEQLVDGFGLCVLRDDAEGGEGA